jgi:ubiquinone/menaquinone biosynthesis C-methylase UbiE
LTTARYDGQTEWYESFASGEVFSSARTFAVELLGAGPGRCLDLGCGTGRAVRALVQAGWSVVGTDSSIDQLEGARKHLGNLAELVHADAHDLPFDDEEFDAVISILTHTDFDDVTKAFTEARRALRVGGTFVYLGVHPCFGSPFVARGEAETIEGAAAIVHPGYRSTGWKQLPADPTSTKIRSRVGINHLPLAGFLNAIIRSGFTIEQVEEPGDADPPLFLAVKATRRS